MNTGTTYIEINYDAAWVTNALANLQGFSWLFEWGMYLFMIVALAILFWIFYDSVTKNKGAKSLLPRILSIVGCFLIIPAYIFRFTGNADGVTTLVKLGAELGTPYYPGPINWNVLWLVNGYGTAIAIICLIGILVSIAALVIYMSSVQRAKPSTEFVQAFNSKMSNLEAKVDDARRSAESAAKMEADNSSKLSAAVQASQNSRPRGGSPATIIDRKPQAATIIDLPSTGDTLVVYAGNNRGNTFNLPAKNMVIGREPTCDIVLDDGKVSREHARLVYGDGMWSVVDLGSANGTYVGGQRVVGQRPLANGDQVKIGDTVLVFGSPN